MPSATSNSRIEYTFRNEGGRSGRRERWAPGANQVVDIVHVGWVDWPAWRTDMIGTSRFNAAATSNTGLSRTPPQTHPQFPWMRVADIELLEVIGVVNDMNTGGISFSGEVGQQAVVVAQVTWAAVPYHFAPADSVTVGNVTVPLNSELNRFVERKSKYNVEALPLKGTQFALKDDRTVTFPGDPTILFPSEDLVYLWHEVPTASGNDFDLPDALLARFKTFPGKINSTEFDGYEAGTLLCGVPERQLVFGANGFPQWEIAYHFQFRPTGWNHKYDPLSGTFREVVIDQNGLPPYKSEDLNLLFKLI